MTIKTKNSQKLSLCYDVDFQKKFGRPGGGGSENSDTCACGGNKLAKICGRPLVISVAVLIYSYYIGNFICALERQNSELTPFN